MKHKEKPILAMAEIMKQQRQIRDMQKKLELELEILYGQGELIHDLLTELKSRLDEE